MQYEIYFSRHQKINLILHSEAYVNLYILLYCYISLVTACLSGVVKFVQMLCGQKKVTCQPVQYTDPGVWEVGLTRKAKQAYLLSPGALAYNRKLVDTKIIILLNGLP